MSTVGKNIHTQYRTAQQSKKKYSTGQHSKAKKSTAQHRTAKQKKIQHSTGQQSKKSTAIFYLTVFLSATAYETQECFFSNQSEIYVKL